MGDAVTNNDLILVTGATRKTSSLTAAVNFTHVKTRATFGNDGALARTDTRLGASIGPSRKIGPA